jgi:hypothetical protein
VGVGVRVGVGVLNVGVGVGVSPGVFVTVIVAVAVAVAVAGRQSPASNTLLRVSMSAWLVEPSLFKSYALLPLREPADPTKYSSNTCKSKIDITQSWFTS